jgi:hypothetical protein
MANKYTSKQWSEARLLFESPDAMPLRQIEEKTKIPFKTIDRIAKKQNWIKGGLTRVISDGIKSKLEIARLPADQKVIVTQKIDTELTNKLFYDDAQNKLASIGMDLIQDKLNQLDLSVNDLRGVSSVVKDSREGVIGKPSAVTVNNQINNNVGLTLEDIRRELDILNGRIIN